MKPAFYLISLLALASCKQSQEQVVAPVPRDTTITRENSYTKLFIDSMTVARFIKTEGISDANAQRIRNFYNKRNYSYAWFTDTGTTVQAQAFWSTHDDLLHLNSDTNLFHSRLHVVMDTLMKNDSMYISPDSLALTEMRLTAHFFEFSRNVFGNKANPEKLQWNIPVRQLRLEDLLDSLLANRQAEWRPINRFFHRMQNEVFRFRSIQMSGKWNKIELPRKPVKPGDRHQVVVEIKARLHQLGHLKNADTSDLFDDSLVFHIKKLRSSYSLAAGQSIDSHLVKQLNVSPETRLRQMLINLERFKWLPEEPQRYVIVNIPDYSLYVIENEQPVLTMRVVVGKAVNRTVIFSGDLKFVVFSPYWNIPPSIVRNEVLPEMNRDDGYLQKNEYEITGYSGGLPEIRQMPGPNNALGLVKFLFPNEYNIYLHDTNLKSLFDRPERAFSHGCIRIQKPFEFAEYLLKEDTSWTTDRIKRSMNAKKESWVTLKKPPKVYILYITSWVDRDGYVNFRKDIYGHDANMSKVLFR